MRVQDAVETLGHALQLGKSEAAIYVQLCVGGPAKAGDLASSLRMHRNEVYRGATRLVQRGLIEMTMERPARFAAVSPKQVFETEIATRLASVDELRSARDVVMPALYQLKLDPPRRSRSTYKVVQGRQEIFATRNRMIEDAERSMDWATTFDAAVPLIDASGGLALMARRVAEGVRLRALLKRDAEGASLLADLAASPVVELREFDVASTVRFFIVDERELLMWVVNDPGRALHAKDEVAIQTTAPGFVQAECLFFEQSWARAKPHALSARAPSEQGR